LRVAAGSTRARVEGVKTSRNFPASLPYNLVQ
jgi:hypothetical protein